MTTTSLNFNLRTVERFSVVLRYNVQNYLDMYRMFVQSSKPLIIEYYQKPDAKADADSFNFLLYLQAQAIKINDLIKIHSKSFKNIDDWNLLDFLEDVRIKLDTIANSSKWLRSSKLKNSWSKISIQYDRTLAKGETIEDVSYKDLNSNNYQDDWMAISLENNLMEKDYTPESRATVTISKAILSQQNLNLNSVVDNLAGEKLYGLDFAKKLTFSNNDLNILGYKETIIQAINILIVLKKGDIPEFNDMGVEADVCVGGNLSVFSNFNLKRQLEAVFGTDDTLRDFRITAVSYSNGGLSVNYEVDSMYNFVYKSTTPIKTAA